MGHRGKRSKEALEYRADEYQAKTFVDKDLDEVIAISRGDAVIKVPIGRRRGREVFSREVVYIGDQGLVLNDSRGTGFLDGLR